MVEENFELTLFDRLEMIRSVLQNVSEDEAYISFSGGKDSVVLSHMIDEAIPHNNYPRVFINTGIEFQAIVNFVKELQKKDSRIVIIQPNRNIKQMLEEDGYPFKSKLHSDLVERFQKKGFELKSVRDYVSEDGKKGRFRCPKKLKYQFQEDGLSFKVSQKCCSNLKKKPARDYEKKEGKTLCILGFRAAEGGIREHQLSTHGCIRRRNDGSIYKFSPLSPCSDEFMNWYVENRKIQLCELYYPPFNFRRTGCKGCPYNIHIGKELEVLKELLPIDYNQCWKIWKPVYEEYARIRYRRVKKVDGEAN